MIIVIDCGHAITKLSLFTVRGTRQNCLTHYLLAVHFVLVFFWGVKGLLLYVRMKHAIHHFLHKAVYFQTNKTCNGQFVFNKVVHNLLINHHLLGEP